MTLVHGPGGGGDFHLPPGLLPLPIDPSSPLWQKWESLGGVPGGLGMPVAKGGVLGIPVARDATPAGIIGSCPDGRGKYLHFQNGSIYWTPETGAWSVVHGIRDKWASLGWERSALRYPISDEDGTPDGTGAFNHFQHGSIYWSPTTGACAVAGAIRDKWASLGWERSYLG
jgi:uncharacterized protein with LGFP repeats